MYLKDSTNNVIYYELNSYAAEFFAFNKNEVEMDGDIRKGLKALFNILREEQIAEYLKGDFDLEYKRLALLEAVEHKKTELNEADIEYKGKSFGADMKSQQLLTQTITLYNLAGGLPEGFGWISADNKLVEMSLEELAELGGLIGARTMRLYVKARELKDEILAAKNKTAINKIKVSFE